MVAYDDVLHNPGSVCVSLPPLPGRALFASVGITSSMASTLFECIIYLAVSTASSRSLSLSLCLPSESFALLRRMFSYHKVRQHNVVVAIVVRQAASIDLPHHPTRCAPFDVLHFFFLRQAVFILQLSSTRAGVDLS